MTTVVECDRCGIVWDVDARPPQVCPNCLHPWSRTRVMFDDDPHEPPQGPAL